MKNKVILITGALTGSKPGPVTEQSAESYATTFDTNVLGTLLSLKHELRVMLPRRQGSIVNVSSTFGRAGGAGASVYVASKHAVEGLTKAAALEVAESGVRVNVVAPGPIETGMLNRFTGNEDKKAALVSRCWSCSNRPQSANYARGRRTTCASGSAPNRLSVDFIKTNPAAGTAVSDQGSGSLQLFQLRAVF
jgi:NAD(P)-dependent dehydrogenase (short-subunit alcohol dehydrogenase family)